MHVHQGRLRGNKQRPSAARWAKGAIWDREAILLSLLTEPLLGFSAGTPKDTPPPRQMAVVGVWKAFLAGWWAPLPPPPLPRTKGFGHATPRATPRLWTCRSSSTTSRPGALLPPGIVRWSQKGAFFFSMRLLVLKKGQLSHRFFHILRLCVGFEPCVFCPV